MVLELEIIVGKTMNTIMNMIMISFVVRHFVFHQICNIFYGQNKGEIFKL